jgi:hypothetical protein
MMAFFVIIPLLFEHPKNLIFTFVFCAVMRLRRAENLPLLSVPAEESECYLSLTELLRRHNYAAGKLRTRPYTPYVFLLPSL